jgi:hypothetical protein
LAKRAPPDFVEVLFNVGHVGIAGFALIVEKRNRGWIEMERPTCIERPVATTAVARLAPKRMRD